MPDGGCVVDIVAPVRFGNEDRVEKMVPAYLLEKYNKVVTSQMKRK